MNFTPHDLFKLTVAEQERYKRELRRRRRERRRARVADAPFCGGAAERARRGGRPQYSEYECWIKKRKAKDETS